MEIAGEEFHPVSSPLLKGAIAVWKGTYTNDSQKARSISSVQNRYQLPVSACIHRHSVLDSRSLVLDSPWGSKPPTPTGAGPNTALSISRKCLLDYTYGSTYRNLCVCLCVGSLLCVASIYKWFLKAMLCHNQCQDRSLRKYCLVGSLRCNCCGIALKNRHCVNQCLAGTRLKRSSIFFKG